MQEKLEKNHISLRLGKFNDIIKLLNILLLSNFNDLLSISKESNVGDKKNIFFLIFHTKNLQFK